MTSAELRHPGPARVIAVVRVLGSPQLPRVLASVAGQTRPPDVLVGVRVGGLDLDTDPDGFTPDGDGDLQAALRPLMAHTHEVVDVTAGALVGDVVATALEAACCEPEGDPADPRHARNREDWLWLVDDDHVPSGRTLELLLDAVDRAPRVAVAGPKHRAGSDGTELLDAGFTTSRLGRRITGVEEGEVDQGQLDAQEDVLAVGLPGALVRRDVWEELGGPDPAVGDAGADLDLCRRARLAGHRVVVVPEAVLTRRPEAPVPWGPGERRIRAHLRLTGAPWWALPGVAASLLLGALARLLLGVAAKEPATGWSAARQAVGALARVDQVARARREAARTRVLPRSRLNPLLVGGRDLARWHRDRWRHQRSPGAVRTRAGEPASVLPLDDRPASRRARVVLPLLVGPALVAAGVAAGWQLLGWLPVVSTAWAGAPGSTRELWDAARSDWVAVGTGAEGPGDALWWVLAVLGFPFGSPSTAVTVLLVAAPALAGASAWWAAGALTRSPWWRTVAALTWAAAPILLVSLGDARVGAVLAHVTLPLAVRAAAQSATGRHRRTSWAWAGAASLALVAVTAGAPALLLPSALALVVVSVLAYRVAPAFVAVPALVLAAPNLFAALPSPVLLFADPGMPSAGSAGPWTLQGWEPLLGWPGFGGQESAAARIASGLSLPPGAWTTDAVIVVVWAAVAMPALLALLALPRALSDGPRGSAVRTGLALASVGLVGALVSSRVEVALAPDGPVTGWTGPSSGLVLLGLMVAGIGGLAGRRAGPSVRPIDAVVVEKSSAATSSDADNASEPDRDTHTDPDIEYEIDTDMDSDSDSDSDSDTDSVIDFDSHSAAVPHSRVHAVLTSPAARHAVRAVGALITAVAILLPVLGLASWCLARVSTPVAGEAAPAREPSLPAVIADAAASPDQVRTLALTPDPSADLAAGVPDVRVSLLRGDGPRLDRVASSVSLREAETAGSDHPARSALDQAVAGLLSVDASAPRVMAPFGVGYVVLLTPTGDNGGADADPEMVEATERLTARLDATSGLTRSGALGRVLAWRVNGLTGQGASAPDRPGAVRVVTDAGWQVLPSAPLEVDTRVPSGEPDVPRTLVLAEAADSDWRATLDGVPLQSVTVQEWAQGFVLPSQGGDLHVEHRTDNGRTWHWVLLATMALAVLVAVPVRRGGPVRSRP